ncbi:MAG: hypothetical protein UU47_C0004G0052 [candidate division TM6 bacterium GW2011_GWE2_41_16]|nr:MAG: hypothetical protein UU47_C0004G0052 [candidate division TM6 bacterium GW2011_GWE2_41_16]
MKKVLMLAGLLVCGFGIRAEEAVAPVAQDAAAQEQVVDPAEAFRASLSDAKRAEFDKMSTDLNDARVAFEGQLRSVVAAHPELCSDLRAFFKQDDLTLRILVEVKTNGEAQA